MNYYENIVKVYCGNTLSNLIETRLAVWEMRHVYRHYISIMRSLYIKRWQEIL